MSSLTAGERSHKVKKAKRKLDLHERAFQKIDTAKELKILEEMIKNLKVDYEQYFLDITPYLPDKLHADLRRQIRKLRKAPFKKLSHKFRLRSLEHRYQVFNDYWQRTLREKEEGRYSKDIFKAELREKNAKEDRLALTNKGKASKDVNHLYQSYKNELERLTGKKQNIDFDAFRRSLVEKAKVFKERSGAQRISFKVAVKNGKVTIVGKAKEPKSK